MALTGTCNKASQSQRARIIHYDSDSDENADEPDNVSVLNDKDTMPVPAKQPRTGTIIITTFRTYYFFYSCVVQFSF